MPSEMGNASSSNRGLAKFFGTWIAKPQSLSMLAIMLIVTVTTAIQAAKNLGDPLIRWGVTALLGCLAIGGAIVEYRKLSGWTARKAYEHNTNPHDYRKLLTFLIATILLIAFVVSDIAFFSSNRMSFFETADFRIIPTESLKVLDPAAEDFDVSGCDAIVKTGFTDVKANVDKNNPNFGLIDSSRGTGYSISC